MKNDDFDFDADLGDGLLPPEFVKLTKEELAEAKTFTRMQALALVRLYESVQKLRVGQGNRGSAEKREVKVTGPIESHITERLKEELYKVEQQAARGMAAYTKAQPLGQWMMRILGMGPTLACVFLAEFDFHHCCCVKYKGLDYDKVPKHNCPGVLYPGPFISFAGQRDPRDYAHWEKGVRRPYNAFLKRTCHLLGKSFMKQSVNMKLHRMTDKQLFEHYEEEEKNKKGKKLNRAEILAKIKSKRILWPKKLANLENENALYVRLYMDRKEFEIRQNDSGALEKQAREMLANALAKGHKLSPGQKLWWSQGKMQPGGLDLRAMRYAVRKFLQHFHHVGRVIHFGEAPPPPYSQVHLGHSEYLAPPCWEDSEALTGV